MAQAPKTWVEWADFFSKTLIAAAGLFVSIATLVFAQAERNRAHKEKLLTDRLNAESARRNEARTEDSTRRDKTLFILDKLPGRSARASEPADRHRLLQRSDGGGAEDRGERRALPQRQQPWRAAAHDHRRDDHDVSAHCGHTQENPKAFLNSPAVAAQNAGVAAAEAGKPAASGRWFAVVGTLPQSAPQAVGALAEQLNTRLMGAGLPDSDVHVYRTRISKSFALTSGTDKSEEDARARASMLRRAGFSDAFAQPDRGWVRADDLRGR